MCPSLSEIYALLCKSTLSDTEGLLDTGLLRSTPKGKEMGPGQD